MHYEAKALLEQIYLYKDSQQIADRPVQVVLPLEMVQLMQAHMSLPRGDRCLSCKLSAGEPKGPQGLQYPPTLLCKLNGL